jgi:hypothetical protein
MKNIFSMHAIRNTVVAAALVLAPAASFAGVFISVNIAPPILPVYVQPVAPGDGYLWNPGYWAYTPETGYYWVPGVWVRPPQVGLLWTPGYWGWGSGAYLFHEGYWGPHVGFYGGINYGFGYGGSGFWGGRWEGGHFAYNTAVMNVNRTVVTNTYVDNVHVNVNVGVHTAFNGGAGGIQAQPSPQEQQWSHENHIPPTSEQQSHVQMAHSDRGNFASTNGGHPAHVTAVTVINYHSTAITNNNNHNATNNSSRVNDTNVHNGQTDVHNGQTSNLHNGQTDVHNPQTSNVHNGQTNVAHAAVSQNRDNRPQPQAKPQSRPQPKAQAKAQPKAEPKGEEKPRR